MASPERTLYQFRISHYCEKTRWLLDAKGLPYHVRELPPGLHRFFIRALGGPGSVPFLRDGRRALGDSTAIAQAVEEAYPAPPLLPEASDARSRAWDLERWFSGEPGRAIRVYMYGQIMAAGPGRAAGFLLAPFPRIAWVVGRSLAPRIERGLRAAYRIRPDTIEAAQVTIEDAFDRIAELTGGDENAYLVGDRLSVADIAAASMLAPFVAPPGTPWVASRGIPAIEALRDRLQGSAGYRWVEARYSRDRSRSAGGGDTFRPAR